MKIPGRIPEEKQAVKDTENGKRKRKIEHPYYRLVANVIAGRFAQIARHQRSVMPDDDARVCIRAGTVEQSFQAKINLLAKIMQAVKVTAQLEKLLPAQQMSTADIISDGERLPERFGGWNTFTPLHDMQCQCATEGCFSSQVTASLTLPATGNESSSRLR
jgi:hypothetical protein